MAASSDNTNLLLLTLAAATAAITIYRMKNKHTATAAAPLNPITGPITSPFGQRTAPTTGASTYHNGVDIAAPIGTTVHAPWDGTVANTYANSKGGNQLIIQHPNGYRTGYAHLTRALVSPGQTVAQGDPIALTGNTGITTGPHLHFTLTNPNGNKIDPTTLFSFQA